MLYTGHTKKGILVWFVYFCYSSHLIILETFKILYFDQNDSLMFQYDCL